MDVGLLITRRPLNFTSSPALICGHLTALSTRSFPKSALEVKKIALYEKIKAISAC